MDNEKASSKEVEKEKEMKYAKNIAYLKAKVTDFSQFTKEMTDEHKRKDLF